MRAATAQMEWTARSGIYEYTSAPLAASTTDAAQMARRATFVLLTSSFLL
jgi:hypothetical protein